MRGLGAVSCCLIVFFCFNVAGRADTPSDDDFKKAGASRALADVILTDQIYDQFMHMLVQQQAASMVQSDPAFEKLAEKNADLFEAAAVASTKRLVPREMLLKAYSSMLASRLSFADLKGALAFIQSENGRHFWQLVNDQSAFAAALDELPPPEQAEVERVLRQEVQSRFPSAELRKDSKP